MDVLSLAPHSIVLLLEGALTEDSSIQSDGSLELNSSKVTSGAGSESTASIQEGTLGSGLESSTDGMISDIATSCRCVTSFDVCFCNLLLNLRFCNLSYLFCLEFARVLVENAKIDGL